MGAAIPDESPSAPSAPAGQSRCPQLLLVWLLQALPHLCGLLQELSLFPKHTRAPTPASGMTAQVPPRAAAPGHPSANRLGFVSFPLPRAPGTHKAPDKQRHCHGNARSQPRASLALASPDASRSLCRDPAPWECVTAPRVSMGASGGPRGEGSVQHRQQIPSAGCATGGTVGTPPGARPWPLAQHGFGVAAAAAPKSVRKQSGHAAGSLC